MPCILYRQLLDHGGFYERSKLFWVDVQDCLHTAAAAPPGGGRHELPSRLLWRYAVAYIPTPRADIMSSIFSGMLGNFIEGFDETIAELLPPIIKATLELYRRITATLLPTPSRSHYLFNLRDISKVFQGLMMGSTKA